MDRLQCTVAYKCMELYTVCTCETVGALYHMVHNTFKETFHFIPICNFMPTANMCADTNNIYIALLGR